MRLLDRLRTVFPPVAGFLGSSLAVWAVKKGVPLTETQSTAAVTALGGLLWKAIAAHTNPNDAAAPSLVRNAPMAPEMEIYRDTIDDPAAAAQQMREAFGTAAEAGSESPSMPVIPLPTAAPTATSAQFIEGFECPFCGGDNNYHLGWCKLGGGNGVAPPGFANDTRRINHVHMRKLLADVESGRASPEVMAAVKQATAQATEPPPQRSPYLKPKVSEAEKSKDVVKVRRKPRKAR